MNAKEFTCGLSDICLGSDDERQGFAYRFYDITGVMRASKMYVNPSHAWFKMHDNQVYVADLTPLLATPFATLEAPPGDPSVMRASKLLNCRSISVMHGFSGWGAIVIL